MYAKYIIYGATHLQQTNQRRRDLSVPMDYGWEYMHTAKRSDSLCQLCLSNIGHYSELTSHYAYQ